MDAICLLVLTRNEGIYTRKVWSDLRCIRLVNKWQPVRLNRFRDIPNQNDLNSYRGTFHGFGELGQNSTIPFEKSSNY